MEQKELAIHVDRVSKVYKLYRRNRDRLIESLGLTKKKLSTPHYALKDVSLDIYKGEVSSVISTLSRFSCSRIMPAILSNIILSPLIPNHISVN